MNPINRRSFFGTAAAGIAAIGLAGQSTPMAQAQLVYAKKDWKIEEFDRLAKSPARVKQVYDIVGVGEGKFLNNVKNSLNGFEIGWGIPKGEVKVAVGMHGPANMLNYDDTIWSKYGIGAWLKVMDPETGKPAARNPYYASKGGANPKYSSQDPNSEDSLYQDTSMQALQSRGVVFMSCHTADEEQARAIVKHNNLSMKPEALVEEMLAHTVPGVLVVAAMVAAIALLQSEGHYSYIKV
jgi:intracellular sulfur oxidation DsrE/DsrF family protein